VLSLCENRTLLSGVAIFPQPAEVATAAFASSPVPDASLSSYGTEDASASPAEEGTTEGKGSKKVQGNSTINESAEVTPQGKKTKFPKAKVRLTFSNSHESIPMEVVIEPVVGYSDNLPEYDLSEYKVRPGSTLKLKYKMPYTRENIFSSGDFQLTVHLGTSYLFQGENFSFNDLTITNKDDRTFAANFDQLDIAYWNFGWVWNFNPIHK